MATTSTFLSPGSTTLPGSSTIPGQGLQPILRCRLSFDDVSDSTPSWTEVAGDKIRSWSVSRGRQTELDEFDAGTATIVLDNGDRAYDPNQNASVRPLNRIWMYYEFSGTAGDLFRGYVDTWKIDWPQPGFSDSTATASCVDEFGVLAMMALPVTNPPRGSYEDLVMSDRPDGYWDMNEDPSSRTRASKDQEPWEFTAPSDPPWTMVEWGTKRHDLRRNLLRGKRKR